MNVPLVQNPGTKWYLQDVGTSVQDGEQFMMSTATRRSNALSLCAASMEEGNQPIKGSTNEKSLFSNSISRDQDHSPCRKPRSVEHVAELAVEAIVIMCGLIDENV